MTTMTTTIMTISTVTLTRNKKSGERELPASLRAFACNEAQEEHANSNIK